MSLRRIPPFFLFLALMGAGTAAFAAPPARRQAPPQTTQPRVQQPAQRPQRQHSDDALSDSVRRIERSTRGQVLSAERVPYDGRNVNRIKVIDDRGRVRVYMDDPQNPKARQPQPDPPTRGDDD